MKNIRAIGKNVLIKELKEEKKTSSGLIITSPIETELARGVVINYGMEVECGFYKGETKVLFEKWGAPKIDAGGGEEYFVVDEDKIVAVYE